MSSKYHKMQDATWVSKMVKPIHFPISISMTSEILGLQYAHSKTYTKLAKSSTIPDNDIIDEQCILVLHRKTHRKSDWAAPALIKFQFGRDSPFNSPPKKKFHIRWGKV
ncbi:hypothetical protein V6N13_001676 [Hibiscus sabdariffa]